MSTSADFLVELGTEELPPKALKNLGESFLNGILNGLKSEQLQFKSANVFMAPRRLAVQIHQLQTKQLDRQIITEGPPVANSFDQQGNPSPAALGFAKKSIKKTNFKSPVDRVWSVLSF